MIRYIKDILEKISNFGNSSFHQITFEYALYVSYILFAIALTNIIQINPLYLSYIDTFIKYYVSLFLIARFNPIVSNKTKFTKFDAKIAWSAGVFLFITTSAFQIINNTILSKTGIR